MFQTFRQKLLFWFLVFTLSNVVIIGISHVYLLKRDQVSNVAFRIQELYLTFLRDIKVQRDFLSHESTNPTFFISQHSPYLERHKELISEIEFEIDRLLSIQGQAGFDFKDELILSKRSIREHDSCFQIVATRLWERGFKDYNQVGQMRFFAHQLEKLPHNDMECILTLRRHEKDYLIRNEEAYVNKFNDFSKFYLDKIENQEISGTSKDSLKAALHQYSSMFNQIVDLDQRLGIRGNIGMKEALDLKSEMIQTSLNALLLNAEERKSAILLNMSFLYGTLVFVLLGLGILLSFLIAVRITKPLRELTWSLGTFVEGNFGLENGDSDKNMQMGSQDEIGRLVHNFSLLKDEMVGQLGRYKKKIESRITSTEAENKKLKAGIELGDKFLPKDFLKLLGNENEEMVKVGDYVEEKMTILYTNIHEFTQYAQALSPKDNLDFLNLYLGFLTPIIHKHNGYIDRIMGDTVLALFPEQPLEAVNAAIEIQNALVYFSGSLNERGWDSVHLGMGIHTGNLVMGTVGNEDHLDTAIVSEMVLSASRVERFTKTYKTRIMASQLTINGIQKMGIAYRMLDMFKVQGKALSTAVYEIFDQANDSVAELKIQTRNRFEESVFLFQDEHYQVACKNFEAILDINPHDQVSRVYKDRCEELIKGSEESKGTA